jgi:hypothetical protein
MAVIALSHTLLMFDSFHDVEEKARNGNPYAAQVLKSWADAEWFMSRDKVPEKITVTVFKVSGETNKGLYTASKDNSVTPAVDLQVAVNTFTVNDADNQPYSDLECKVMLDYNFPSDAATVDDYTDTDSEEFVFDEIGLITEAGTYLTHLIFHPIQKSKNRKLEIIYTLRIRAGV